MITVQTTRRNLNKSTENHWQPKTCWIRRRVTLTFSKWRFITWLETRKTSVKSYPEISWEMAKYFKVILTWSKKSTRLCWEKETQEPPELVFQKSWNSTESPSIESLNPNLSMRKVKSTKATLFEEIFRKEINLKSQFLFLSHFFFEQLIFIR